MRIGHGYDAHRFENGKPLVLGGVTIPYESGLKAHSDGDVLAHAVMDALLGAAGLPDIGALYPDTSDDYAGMFSMKLVEDVSARIGRCGYAIEYVDATLIAEAPKLSPHIDEIRSSFAAHLGIAVSRVNVKATTEEKMGFTGRLEGISAHAVCLLIEVNP